MEEPRKAAQEFPIGRRLMKMGGSLVVTLPNEVIEQWNLKKGDEVRVSVQEGAVRIQPKQPTRTQTISEQALETYSSLMKGIQAKVTLDSEGSALHLEFSGGNKDAVGLVLHNLWRNLPFLLSMLGLGSVEEVPRKRQKVKLERNRRGGQDTDQVA